MLWINKKSEDKTAEDIAEGQIVIITARWILILAGWVLAGNRSKHQPGS